MAEDEQRPAIRPAEEDVDWPLGNIDLANHPVVRVVDKDLSVRDVDVPCAVCRDTTCTTATRWIPVRSASRQDNAGLRHRNDTIALNLPRALPKGGLVGVIPDADSASVRHTRERMRILRLYRSWCCGCEPAFGFFGFQNAGSDARTSLGT